MAIFLKITQLCKTVQTVHPLTPNSHGTLIVKVMGTSSRVLGARVACEMVLTLHRCHESHKLHKLEDKCHCPRSSMDVIQMEGRRNNEGKERKTFIVRVIGGEGDLLSWNPIGTRKTVFMGYGD